MRSPLFVLTHCGAHGGASAEHAQQQRCLVGRAGGSARDRRELGTASGIGKEARELLRIAAEAPVLDRVPSRLRNLEAAAPEQLERALAKPRPAQAGELLGY